MGKYRTLSQKNEYYLPKHSYLTCVHYALQYRDWKAELDANRDTRGAIRYDKDRVQITPDYDSTSETAIRMVEISKKVALIEKCIRDACMDNAVDQFIKLSVCYGFTFYQLRDQGMPCGRNLYYNIRRRFYYVLSKKI